RHVRQSAGAEAGHPGRPHRRPHGHGRTAGPDRPRRTHRPALRSARSPMITPTPQPPGRTPHKAPQAPLRCPGGQDQPPEAREARRGRPPAREADVALRTEPVAVLISASDTDLLAARASGAPWRLANPARTAPDQVPGLMAGAYCIVVRLLG